MSGDRETRALLQWPADKLPCPPPALVHAASAGVLPPALDARVSAHVKGCATCRTLVEALDHPSVSDLTTSEYHRIRSRIGVQMRRGPDRSAASWRWAAAMVAAVTLGAAGSVLVWQATDARTVQGSVATEDGRPIAGATVARFVPTFANDELAVLRRTGTATTSDATGTYVLPGVTGGRRAVVRAFTPGYFSTGNPSPPPVDGRVNFHLRPWTLTAPGAPIKGVIEASDICGLDRCRQFAVELPGEQTVEFSLATPVREMMDLWIEIPGGDIYSPRVRAPLRVVVPALAPGVYQISVVDFAWTEPRPFEVTMRLR